MNEKVFIEYITKLGIDIDEEKINQLRKYHELIVEKNKVMNLTNITKKEDVYLKHFYDSLTINYIYDLKQSISLCDVGTGAGFPGIVLKIMFPQLKVVLIDSLGKRIAFLKEVIKALNLKSIEAIHVRAEDYARMNRETFDVVTSRAVARLNILNELCLPLVKKGGYFISMKGHAEEEAKEAENSFKILKSEIVDIKTFSLPFEESVRTLIKIRKNEATTKTFPRNFKEIKRKPL
ncbi:MAG: 16S rRNA (guanine(527)-N(7))-methyltransferase RsmG [Bacilli bacterium]|nr:16S rRNA (guanine(527)-N(7))-methyltransferase RsmG [Bacilli bacterium]